MANKYHWLLLVPLLSVLYLSVCYTTQFSQFFSINNKNLAIANKPRDAATLFQIKKDDLEMTLKISLKVIANNTMGFPIQYNTKFVMHRTSENESEAQYSTSNSS